MTTPLDSAAQELRSAHARLMGVLDAAHETAVRVRASAHQRAQAELMKQRATVHAKAAQAIFERGLRVRDIAEVMLKKNNGPLNVAEYITLGKISIDESALGMDAETGTPFILPLIGHGNVIIETSADRWKEWISSGVPSKGLRRDNSMSSSMTRICHRSCLRSVLFGASRRSLYVC